MATQLTAAEAGDNVQPNLLALCSIMIALPTVALSLRLWSNHITYAHRWGWDDFFAVLALPFIIALNGVIIWWIDLGLGKHAATAPEENLAKVPKIIFVGAFLYDCGISLPKFSVLFFYRRIFETTSWWLTIALWTVGAMNAGWLVSALVSTIFQCSPINAAWETVPGSTCIPQWDWFLGTALPSMIIDLCILIIPMPILLRLQAPLARRVKVGVLFLCGYSVIVISIGRLVSIAKAGPHLLDDINWTTITYMEWLLCEGPISLVSVCLPNIFRLFKRASQDGIRGMLPDSRGGSKMVSSDTNASRKGQFIRMADRPSHSSKQMEGTADAVPEECQFEQDRHV
ncbi:hypothetical protein PG993_011320, partial [Apiospora rasikravindrae]